MRSTKPLCSMLMNAAISVRTASIKRLPSPPLTSAVAPLISSLRRNSMTFAEWTNLLLINGSSAATCFFASTLFALAFSALMRAGISLRAVKYGSRKRSLPVNKNPRWPVSMSFNADSTALASSIANSERCWASSALSICRYDPIDMARKETTSSMARINETRMVCVAFMAVGVSCES